MTNGTRDLLHGVIPAFETGTGVSLASPRVFLALFGLPVLIWTVFVVRGIL